MNRFVEYIKTETSASMLKAILSTLTAKFQTVNNRVLVLEAELEKKKTERDIMGGKLLAAKNRADELHNANLKPVTDALDSTTAPDIELTQTIAVGTDE